MSRVAGPRRPPGRCKGSTKLRHWLLPTLLWLFAVLVSPVCAAQEAGVWIALSETGGAYAEAGNALRAELAERRIDSRLGTWQDAVTGGVRPQLIITVGAGAYRAIVEDAQRGGTVAGVPVLATFLPRSLYESLSSKLQAPNSAIWLDQPLSRFVDLIRLTMPDRRRLGVLLGSESTPLAAQLSKVASARGLQVVTAHVSTEPELYPALRNVLVDADVLLALPDARVFNTGTLQNILITTYRQRVPVIAFAPGYVRAGATMALFVSPEQVASQAATVARSVLNGRPMPAPQSATDFSVLVNERVARSLGLNVGSGTDVAETMRRQEGQR